MFAFQAVFFSFARASDTFENNATWIFYRQPIKVAGGFFASSVGTPRFFGRVLCLVLK